VNDSQDELEQSLHRIVAELVPNRVLPDCETRFLAVGFDSIELTRITQALQIRLGRPLPAVLFFEHNTLERVAQKLLADDPDACAKLR
jgi:Phosphopantetheine attachment site